MIVFLQIFNTEVLLYIRNNMALKDNTIHTPKLK